MLETAKLPTDKVMAEMLEIRFNTKIVAITYMGDSQYSCPEETTFLVDKSALTEDDLENFKDTSTWEGGNDFITFWSTNGKCLEPISDPRTDLGAALDLFHWSIFGGVNDFIVRPFKGGWEIFNEDNESTFAFIETSDFCLGVCDLASRVTGIK